jgi:hypothetical protein
MEHQLQEDSQAWAELKDFLNDRIARAVSGELSSQSWDQIVNEELGGVSGEMSLCSECSTDEARGRS